MKRLYEDTLTRVLYSTDASILEVTPQAVAFPANDEELEHVVDYAIQNKLSITPRGAGTGITGACLGGGIVLDCARHLHSILHIDPIHKKATVEPGVIQDDLNKALKPHHLRLGPDTSTGDRATIGGMIANCAAGSRSLRYGTMREAIDSVELLLSTGETLHLCPLSEEKWKEKCLLGNREGEIYRALEKIRTHYKNAIQEAFPKLARRSSGYALDTLLEPFPINPAKLIAGSVGTLGIIKKATLHLAEPIKNPILGLISYASLQEAFEDVIRLLSYKPAALELIDEKIMVAGIQSPSLRGKIDFIDNPHRTMIIAEFEKETLPPNVFEKIVHEPQKMSQVWDLRKAGLGLLLSKRSYSRAIAFIEDLSIAPSHLAPFMKKFLAYLKKQGKEAGIYGHVGPGCLHIRPYIDLREADEVALMKNMMQDITQMIKEEKGALSGEHGDGLIRSWLYPELFGKEICKAFSELKHAFDPHGLMNPHKIVNPLPIDSFLKKSPKHEPDTFFSFKKEGGFSLAVDLCNGNGACRKKEGVMCPSFQATQNEYDSTRARANALRSLLNGKLSTDALNNPEIHAILDLCLQCKGCKTECPSQVDMAKMKSETLFHWNKTHGPSLRDRLFASIDTLSRFGYPLRLLLNPLLQSSLFKWLMRLSSKPLPSFSSKRFSDLYKTLEQPEGPAVALINDTYTEYYCPEVGVAAVKVLNSLGYHVLLPEWRCCGRAALSKGFLEEAKAKALSLIKPLQPLALQGIPLIGLEPSCYYSIQDEYLDLIPEEVTPILDKLHYFDSFLYSHLPLSFQSLKPAQIALHGHCHQKALEGMQTTLDLLRSIPQLQVVAIPSGCCGMAGAFGHEAEHEKISDQIANLSLLPFINQLPSETIIISSGFSCRSQMRSHDIKALHLAEFICTSLEKK